MPRDRTGEPVEPDDDEPDHRCERGWLPGHTPDDEHPRPCLVCRPWLRDRKPPTRDELDDYHRRAATDR